MAGSRARTHRARWAQGVLALCALVSILTSFGILWVLASESWTFFQLVDPVEFFMGTEWTPLLEPRRYGILPLLYGTWTVALGAMLVSLPLGLGAAIFLSEYARPSTRRVVKPLIEILAGIPTIVFGYFAISLVTPMLRLFFEQTEVFNAASASIVVGIMILPMVVSLTDDALRAVPQSLRDGARALSATRFEVAVRVVLPAALSGVLAAVILAVSRAVGETMATTLAAGATPRLGGSPLESVQTMTAYIVQVTMGDTPAGSVAYQTMYAVGMMLFVMTLFLNAVSVRVVRRFGVRA